MSHYVAIMAGGVGSRFWPGSREARPKQFLDILGVGKSLLRLTFERFLPLVPADRIYIVTNAMYKDLVLEQLPELSPEQVLCEPSRNNTAPCIAYTAFKLHGLDPDACFVVSPSDQVILKEDVFRDKIKQALEYAEQNDALVTLGIQPTRPDTGYGYINYDFEAAGPIFPVKQFTEKPNVELAKAFVASGEYLWNAGIFIWHTQHVINALAKHAQELHDMFATSTQELNCPTEQAFIDAMYPNTPNISIDYAIMEKADNVFTLPADIGWSDLGTWASLHAEVEKDADNNVIMSGEQLILNSHNNIVRSSGDKLVVLKDLDDYIVIDEPDVLLIIPKHKEQEIKHIIAQVGKRFL